MIGKKTGRVLMLLAAIAMPLSAAACDSNNQAASSSESNVNQASPSTSSSNSAVDKGPAMEAGPLGKYSPPITLTTVRSRNPDAKDAPGMTFDDNIWTKSFAEDLGINLKNDWVVTPQQYSDKMTVSMVAGKLPDFYEVNAQQFMTLVKAEQVADLTDVYQNYASDLTKEAFASGSGSAIKAATIDGKLLALPIGGGGIGNLEVLWIRNDWLNNLRLQPPKTMDDVMNIAKAFANDDPDKDNKKDSIGLGISNELFSGYFSLTGFFNGYHAYPYNPSKGDGTELTILKDASGNPVWAETLPEMKVALTKLNELYKAGAIDPEFNSTDGGKAGDLTTQGKIGMFFGRWQMATWPINNMKKDDPKVDWQAYLIPSSDGQPVKALSPGGAPSRYIVVNKNCEHPEAVIKLLNYYHEKLNGPHPDEAYHQVVEDGATYQIFSYAPITGSFSNTNENDNAAIQEALKTGDDSKLSPAAQVYWKGIQAYDEGKGDLSQWMWYAIFGPKGTFNLMAQYEDNGNYVQTLYHGSPTPTMISKGGALRDLELQTITKIIMGVDPVDSWDQFVENWKKQGGDDILQEVKDSGLFN